MDYYSVALAAGTRAVLIATPFMLDRSIRPSAGRQLGAHHGWRHTGARFARPYAVLGHRGCADWSPNACRRVRTPREARPWSGIGAPSLSTRRRASRWSGTIIDLHPTDMVQGACSGQQSGAGVLLRLDSYKPQDSRAPGQRSGHDRGLQHRLTANQPSLPLPQYSCRQCPLPQLVADFVLDDHLVTTLKSWYPAVAYPSGGYWTVLGPELLESPRPSQSPVPALKPSAQPPASVRCPTPGKAAP